MMRVISVESNDCKDTGLIIFKWRKIKTVPAKESIFIFLIMLIKIIKKKVHCTSLGGGYISRSKDKTLQLNVEQINLSLFIFRKKAR
jgi:hypothetical protein